MENTDIGEQEKNIVFFFDDTNYIMYFKRWDGEKPSIS